MVSTNSQINLINLAVNVKRYSTCVWHFVDATRCRVSYYNLIIFIFFSILLTINAPIPKNGQTHSNNLSAAADELFEWAVKGLILKDPFISESCIEIKIELNFYFKFFTLSGIGTLRVSISPVFSAWIVTAWRNI